MSGPTPIDAEIIAESPQALVHREHALAELAPIARPPEVVLQEAQRAAAALQQVIAAKPKQIMMNGEQYLEFEDWQTAGRFYGVTAKEDGDAEYVQLGPVTGFKASSVAVGPGGEALSRATAFCLNDEEKWRSRPKYEWHMVLKSGGTAPEDESDRNDWVWEENPNNPGKQRPKKERVHVGEEPVPLFQLASMAQTRANAKVLRNVLAWVVVLAGYRPTPAEELPQADAVDAPEHRKKAVVEFDGKMPFGKHKGVPIEEVPRDYIEWCLESMGAKLAPNYRKAFGLELDRRTGVGG